MRTSFTLTTLSAVLLAAATVAQAGGGVNYGGGGGGGRSMGGGGGGFGGASGYSGGRGSMGVSGGGGMRAPSASPGGGGGRGAWNGNGGNGSWNGYHGNRPGYGNGNWHGNGHGHGHGYGYRYGGYYPYYYGGWWWPAWGASIALASTWPYWSGAWVDPYYYGTAPTYSAPPTYYYGPQSGTIIHREQGPTGVQQGPAYRLYCPATNAFYPEVSECSQQWLKVLPNDGTVPTPPESMPQPAPQSRAPAVRPSNPGVSRPHEATASAGAPQYVRMSTTSSASIPVSANAAMPARAPSAIPVSTHVGAKIPAPRMALPGMTSNPTLVAEHRAE